MSLSQLERSKSPYGRRSGGGGARGGRGLGGVGGNGHLFRRHKGRASQSGRGKFNSGTTMGLLVDSPREESTPMQLWDPLEKRPQSLELLLPPQSLVISRIRSHSEPTPMFVSQDLGHVSSICVEEPAATPLPLLCAL